LSAVLWFEFALGAIAGFCVGAAVDTFLKQRQYNTEIWKVVIAAAAAGAALAGAFIGLGAVLARHL